MSEEVLSGVCVDAESIKALKELVTEVHNNTKDGQHLARIEIVWKKVEGSEVVAPDIEVGYYTEEYYNGR